VRKNLKQLKEKTVKPVTVLARYQLQTDMLFAGNVRQHLDRLNSQKRITMKSNKVKRQYQKPKYRIEKTMTFMFDNIKKRGTKIGCRQCSSCHGCR